MSYDQERKRLAVLVTPCMLAPGLQAMPKPGEHWGNTFVSLIMKYGVDIIPLSCPESLLGGFANGLHRKTHGPKYYSELEGYSEHCYQLAHQTTAWIRDMQIGGYQFLCIIGVEHSPTCAANIIYSNSGTLKQRGIYFEFLSKLLKEKNISIPIIGTMRKSSPTALARLEKILKAHL